MCVCVCVCVGGGGGEGGVGGGLYILGVKKRENLGELVFVFFFV